LYWQEELFCLSATEDEEEERRLEECRKRNLEVIKAKQRQKMEGVSEGDETAGDWNLGEAGCKREETKEKEEVYLQRISLPKFHTFPGSLFDMLSGPLCVCVFVCFVCVSVRLHSKVLSSLIPKKQKEAEGTQERKPGAESKAKIVKALNPALGTNICPCLCWFVNMIGREKCKSNDGQARTDRQI